MRRLFAGARRFASQGGSKLFSADTRQNKPWPDPKEQEQQLAAPKIIKDTTQAKTADDGLQLPPVEEKSQRTGSGTKDSNNIFLSCIPREKVESLDLSSVGIMNIFHKNEKDRIPRLNKTLEPMVYRKGIYRLMEMKSKIPARDFKHLHEILQPEDATMEAIGDYIHASQDPNLLRNAHSMHCSLVTSTSACSSLLSHIFFAVSMFNEPNLTFLKNFQGGDRVRYMNAQKKPYSHCLRVIDKERDIWGLDSYPTIFEPNHRILMELGKILERAYTMEPDEFDLIFNKKKADPAAFANLEKDYHRFMVLNKKIALRSQIDCHSDIDGTDKIFEIKTRALAPIRYDIEEYQKYLDYSLDFIAGEFCSYEREYYDLVRGGMLKYFFQLKIGAMDGAFVGYHNTQHHFGFEYIKLQTIERVLFGSSFRANIAFAISSRVMSMAIDRVKDYLKNEKFNFLNFSVFADGMDNKLTFMTEVVDYIEYADFRKMELKKTQGLMNISDFYARWVGKENVRVFKVELFLYPKVNGVYDPLFLHTLKENDLVEMDFRVQPIGFIKFEEYMQFMTYATKHDLMILEQKYMGYWGTYNSSYTIS